MCVEHSAEAQICLPTAVENSAVGGWIKFVSVKHISRLYCAAPAGGVCWMGVFSTEETLSPSPSLPGCWRCACLSHAPRLSPRAPAP